MRKCVAIVGGGIAGMTAAHELIERGFDVKLFERRERLGGKAASTWSSNGFPAEHGFRFFPGWYQHLPDTLKRIPYERRQTSQRVYDNLVAARSNLFASYHRAPVEALVRFPRSLSDLRTVVGFPQQLLNLGITGDDLQFFFTKLSEFAMTPEEVRIRDFDAITWWQFLEAETRSPAFRRYLVDGLTRTTVAAKPMLASAYTIGQVALRTLFDALRPEGLDRVLNGTTSETWIDPWARFLRAQGVDIYTEFELDSIEVGESAIDAIYVTRHSVARRRAAAKLDAIRVWRRILAERAHRVPPLARPPGTAGDREWSEPNFSGDAQSELVRWADAFFEGRGGQIERAARTWNGLPRIPNLDLLYADAWREHESHLRAERTQRVVADYYVFALPVEQMAYYVKRTDAIRRLDPSLSNILLLAEHVDWLAGIQFYLTEKENITAGHIDCVDSEWHLTAISQTQFWADVDLKELGKGADRGRVKAILSVDIAAWDVKGGRVRKEAFSCTRDEVAEEVWDELKRSLNRPNRDPVLRDEMLLGYNPMDRKVPASAFWLDDAIADRFDRRKHGVYKKLESVRFSSEAILARQKETGEPALETSFVFGDRLVTNVEPLLINRVGALPLRPSPRTQIGNMFLAADYVKTNTNLTTMESANEAARSAVNAILLEAGSREEPCRIWSWHPADVLRNVEGLLLRRGTTLGAPLAATPFRLAAETTSSFTKLAARTLGRWVERSKNDE